MYGDVTYIDNVTSHIYIYIYILHTCFFPREYDVNISINCVNTFARYTACPLLSFSLWQVEELRRDGER